MSASVVQAPLTVGSYAHSVIQKQFQRLFMQESAVLEDLDPEPLHQMRVAMRRLRAALYTFSAVVRWPQEIAVQDIAKTSRRLGKARDLDVLQDSLTQDYQPLLHGIEQDQLQAILKSLQTQRKHCFSDLKRTLKSDRYLALKQTLVDWLAAPTFHILSELPLSVVVPDLVLPPTSRLLLDPAWWIGRDWVVGASEPNPTPSALLQGQQPFELGQLDQHQDALHRLRKQVKGVRYQAELFTDLYGQSYRDYLADLKRIQNILGQIQDCSVLDDFLVNELETRLEDVMPTVARRLQQVQLQAWQAWQPIQQRFINPEFRQTLRSQLINPRPEPTP